MKRIIDKILGRSDIYLDGDLYMTRWRFVHNKLIGFRMHHILRSDKDRELHDHPFSFISLIVRGGYYEHTIDGRRTWYGPGSVLFRSADTLHRLEMGEGPATTLVLRGPMMRTWGFLTKMGWVPHQQFFRRGSEIRNQELTGR